jgi:phosphatidylglycerophosphatase A
MKSSLFAKAAATVFFIGYLPFAQGTFASLAGFLLLFLLNPPVYVHLIISIVLLVVGVFVSNKAEQLYGVRDPQHVVIDELTGCFFSMLFLPMNIGYMIAGFFIFRFFDILKPAPIKQIENYFKGGYGIMFDDVFAAIYTNAILQIWRLLT